MPLCPALGRSLASSPPPTGRSWLEFMMDETELGTQNKRINARASRELYFANKPAGILHYLPLIFYISLHSRTSTIFPHPENPRANRSFSAASPTKKSPVP